MEPPSSTFIDMGSTEPSTSGLDDLGSMKPFDLDENASLRWKLRWLLKNWLKSLQESGVDLEEYGRKETDLHQKGLVTWNLSYDYQSDRHFLTSLTYGPSISDWKIMIEVRPRDSTESVAKIPEMPGGWIEDDSCEEDEQLGVEEEEHEIKEQAS